MAPPPTLQELIEIVRRDAGSDQPLDQLVAAAAAAAQLEETTDALLGHFVDRCRRDGRSWTEISNALGVTKQAVHKRFAPALAAHIAAATPNPTFERFTDRARHVVASSQQAATSLGAEGVGPEHLLLGLFAEPAGIAGRVLTAMNVSEDSVRTALTSRQAFGPDGKALGPDGKALGPDGKALGQDGTTEAPGDAARRRPAGDTDQSSAAPRFTDDAKQALRDALAEALRFGHNYIGTEHLLLGLYRNPDSTAAWVLLEAGALEATARAHVTDLLRRLK
jgi:ATP-dependent Clp protease ATP-binding subunit ClpA